MTGARKSHTRRDLLKALGLGAVALGTSRCRSLGPGGARSRNHPQPNIIFIMVDDLGPEWVGCYGSEETLTPNVDALARGGDAEPARRALATHLETGKIEPLAVAAVRALAASGDLERLRAAAGSDSERVKRVAERALAAAEPPASQPQAPDPADADPE